MTMQLQASKSALCAIILLVAVLLALSALTFGGAMLTGLSPGGIRTPVDIASRQHCDVGARFSLTQTQVTPARERPTLNASPMQQDPTYLGETPC